MNIWKKIRRGEESLLLFKENVIYFIASISIKHILSPCSSEKFKLVIEQDKVLMFFISKKIF